MMHATRRDFLGAVATASAVSGPTRAVPAPGTRAVRFFVAVVTPMDRAGRPDEPLVRDLLALLREHGADGVLVMGSNGEFSSFSVAERKRNLEVYLRAKGGLEVMCQTGTPNLPETLDLLRHAADAGADEALVLPPFYIKNPPLEGLVRYYSSVLDSARVPVLLYHIPATSGVPITTELLKRLEGHPRLYGLKDSSGDAAGTAAFIQTFPKLKIFTGSARHIAAMLKLGAAGAITGNGNILARETAAVLRAFRAGKDTAEAQAKLDWAQDVLRGSEGVPGMKFALGTMGLRESYCRPPLVELTPDKKEEYKAKLARLRQGS